jgi:hypothetical protein
MQSRFINKQSAAPEKSRAAGNVFAGAIFSFNVFLAYFYI